MCWADTEGKDQDHGGSPAGGKLMVERLPYKKKKLIWFDLGSETGKWQMEILYVHLWCFST